MTNPFPELRPFDTSEDHPAVGGANVVHAESWFAQEMQRQRDDDARQTIASSGPPDTIARATRVAKEAGVPPLMVEGRIDEAERGVNGQRLAEVMARYPAIGRFAAANPRAAVVAQDDHKALGILGGAWDFLKNAPGRIGTGLGWRIGQGLTGTWNAIEDTKDLLLTPIYTAMSESSRVYGLPMLDPGDMLEREAATRKQNYAAFSTAADASSKANAGANPITEGLLQGTESVGMSVIAMLTRNPQMAAAAMGTMTGGSSYGDARAAGKSVPDAVRYGLAQGIPEAAFEVAPASRLLTDLAHNLPYGKIVGHYLAEELPNEMATQLFQSYSEWQTLHPEKSQAEWAAGLPAEMQQVALGVLGGGTVTATALKTVQHVSDVAVKVADRYSKASDAGDGKKFFDAAERAAAASKLRARDPEAYAALVKTQAEDAGVAHVYVPAEAIRAYQQSDAYDAYDDPFHAYADAIDEAHAAGGVVVLPPEFALATLPGTPAWAAIKDDMRLTPDGMSARAADAFHGAIGETLDKLSEDVAKGNSDTKAALEKTDALVQGLTNKIMNAGETPYTARQIATFAVHRAQKRAERMGSELTGKEFDALDIVGVLPPALAAARKADATDLVIHALRKGGTAAIGQGPSLLQWIAKRGGVEDRGGDIAAMGGDTWHKGKVGQKKLLKAFDAAQGNMLGGATTDNSLERLFDAAISEGYFPDLLAARENGEKLDNRTMLDAIGRELAGSPVHAREAVVDPMRAAADELAQMLGQRGVDAAALSDDQLRAEIARMEDEGAPGGFEQDSPLNDGPRGRIIFPHGIGRTRIELFQSRNLSTLLHEFGHQWLEELRFDAESPDAPDQLKADWQTVQDWFAANGHPVTDGVIPTDAHELWARGTERYLMEGNAPTGALSKLFETFRGWMISVYKTVAALKAPISPEIREVMDRLIATDDEIQQARESLAMTPLFKDAATAGMAGPEFAAYTEQVATARGDAAGKLLEKTMNAIRRRVSKQWNEEKQTLAGEVAQDIDATPLYRAIAALKSDPVNQEWIVDNMGVDALALLPRRVPPIYKPGGAHPDSIAEQAGYGSGRNMLDSLIGADRQHRQLREDGDKRTMRQRAIDAAVDTEMVRRHGDPFSDGTIEREAQEAVANDMQGEVIATELRVLARGSRNRPTPYAIARQWARDKVRRGVYAVEATAAAIQRHARAVAKAGREAEEAMLKGDKDAAFAAKQRQMLSTALLAESKAAHDEVEAARKRLDKVARAATMKSVDQDYLEQAHALLEAVDLRERSQASINRQGKWAEWAAAREAEGVDVVVPPSFEAMLGKDNWSRLPVETLLGLDAAVKQVMHLGRMKQTLLDNKERRDFDTVVGEAVGAAGNISGPPPRGLDEPSWWDAVKSNVMGADAALLKMETVFDWLDGGNPNGVFNRIVFRPIAEAQAREQDMLKDYYARVKALFEAVPTKVAARWNDKAVLPFTDPFTSRPARMSRHQMVAMALNIGNEGNMQRLADGYGWNAQAIEDYLTGELSAEEWQFVQGIWDTVDTLWPGIEAMERRVNGVAPEKIEPRAFETPHRLMRGGYYPAIYDSTLSYAADKRTAAPEGVLYEAGSIRATTRASSTKARADEVSEPILLDLGVINRHMGEVIHDITHREAVMQAWKFLSNERVMGAVDQALGQDIRKGMRPWVKFVANSWAMERAGNEGVGKWIGKLRANATAVGLGLRATTMVTQLAGYANSIEVVGEAAMAKAMTQFAASPIETTRFVMERSDEVRHRMDTLDRDLRTEIARIAASNPASAAIAKANDAKVFMFHGIGLMDRAVSVPTWIAAYNKALVAGMDEVDAAYAGDKAVRQSQGAGGPKDLAAIQRGTGTVGEALKLFTMFYSYFSAAYQRERTLVRDARGLDSRRPRNVPRLAARAFWLMIAPPLLVELLKMPLGAGGPDDDEWWAQWVMRKLLANALGPIPFARDVFEPMWNSAIKGHFYNPAISPIQRAYDSLTNTAGDLGSMARGDDTKAATRHILETAGYATGLVPGQLAAATQFLVDVGQGDADPQSASDWLEGLSSGKIKK